MAQVRNREARGFQLALTISLLIAVSAFAGPFTDRDLFIHEVPLIIYLLVLPVSWVLIFLLATVGYRTKGLWLLIGAPFVWFWWVLITIGALHGDLP
jgi:hypothetical protein